MKQYEGDAALANLLWKNESILFEDHLDLWIHCKGCRKIYHTSLFMSDAKRWEDSRVLPNYLSDNGRSLLTKRICTSCLVERSQRITRLVEKPRCMTPEAAAVVVDAAMFGIGCMEGTVRRQIELDKNQKVI